MSGDLTVPRDEYAATAELTFVVRAFLAHHERGDHRDGDCPVAYAGDGESLTDVTGMRCDYVERMTVAHDKVRERWGVSPGRSGGVPA